jgi:hypothetical protein
MANDDLRFLSEDIQAKLGVSDALAKKMSSGESLGGSKDIVFDVPIHDGNGSATKGVTTYGVTLRGYGQVIAPANGTWRIVAKLNGNVFIDHSGAKAGEKISFTTGTKWSSTFEIDAWWSEKSNTTLQIKLHVEY